MTNHSLIEDDSRSLSFIPDESVHLIITHPPAFGANCAPQGPYACGQFSAIPEYADYLSELDAVWQECSRVLVPGGHLACVTSPVATREEDLPVTADALERTRRFGLEARRVIRWLPSDRVELDDSAFYGAPNQPCGDLICASQDLLVMRKPGEREISIEAEVASRMAADYFALCSSAVWLVPADLESRHPQSFPLEVAERLVRMFSFAGDTVLDPFAGLGTTSVAALASGRSSIAVEIEPRYFRPMAERMTTADWPRGEITVTKRFLEPVELSTEEAAPV